MSPRADSPLWNRNLVYIGHFLSFFFLSRHSDERWRPLIFLYVTSFVARLRCPRTATKLHRVLVDWAWGNPVPSHVFVLVRALRRKTVGCASSPWMVRRPWPCPVATVVCLNLRGMVSFSLYVKVPRGWCHGWALSILVPVPVPVPVCVQGIDASAVPGRAW